MQSNSHRGKLIIGLLISVLFMYLAFRKVNFREMGQAFAMANYIFLVPAIGITFFSHWLRAIRWRYLLEPIKRVGTFSLFSALIVGYMSNVFLPAHLGEFVRAYILSKKRDLSMSTTFATIVVERVIDIFSLLVLMVFTIFVYPFPGWVTKSGYIMFAITLGLFLFMILLKRFRDPTLKAVRLLARPLPQRWEQNLEGALTKFVDGVVPLRRWHDYLTVSFLSVVIWACYGASFYLCFHAFDFVNTYHLPWSASLVLLVITTVSIVVPSSPGYVGTYHYLCQLALSMFGVPAGPALSYAIAAHGITFIPVFLVGLVFARSEGVALSRMSEARSLAEADEESSAAAG
jgi:glycosyltransferase 2 family protein